MVSRPAVVVLGATGDLATTKLLPALGDGTSATFGDVGFILGDRQTRSPEIAEMLEQSRSSSTDRPFARSVGRLRDDAASGDLTATDTYQEMHDLLTKLGYGGADQQPIFFYCAVPPDLIGGIATNLVAHGLLPSDLDKTCLPGQLIVEKPFGTSRVAAEELWALLTGPPRAGALGIQPADICLVDHYLYKSIVDQMLAWRQSAHAVEWTHEEVKCVQITVAEEERIKKEPRTYNVLGAIGDMIQNHLLQLLCLTAMDLPASNADGTIDYGQVIANGVDVLREVQPYKPDEGDGWFILGQYEGGTSPHLTRETFAALRLQVDTPQWRGVPFFLRTGKGMSQKFAAITVAFKGGRKTVFRIQPKPAVMHWDGSRYVGADRAKSNDPPREEDPHARILEELLNGNLRRAVSRDWTATAWEVVKEPHTMVAQREVKLFEYPRGTDGPGEANGLLTETGHEWLQVGHSLTG